MSTSSLHSLLLGALGFFLTFVPLSRVFIAGVPVYLVDVLIVGLGVVLGRRGLRQVFWAGGAPHLVWFVTVYLILTALSSWAEMLRYQDLLPPLYMLIRHSLAISLFFLVPISTSQTQHRRILLRGILLGSTLGCLVGILFALPPTQAMARELLSIKWLVPHRRWVENPYLVQFFAGSKARSFVGGANILACFTVMTWPLALWASFLARGDKLLRMAGVAAAVTMPVALILTYSRAGYLAAVLVLALFLAVSRTRAKLAVPAVVLFCFGLLWGLEPEAGELYSARYMGDKLRGMSGLVFDQGIQDRIDAYSQLPHFLIENPSYVLVGRGLATRKTSPEDRPILRGTSTTEFGDPHAMVASVSYDRGLLAAVAVTLTALVGALTGVRILRRARQRRAFTRADYCGTAIGFLASIPFFLTEHLLSDVVQGEALWFLFLGLIRPARRPADL